MSILTSENVAAVMNAMSPQERAVLRMNLQEDPATAERTVQEALTRLNSNPAKSAVSAANRGEGAFSELWNVLFGK